MLAASTAQHRQQTVQMARATGALAEPMHARAGKLRRHARAANVPRARSEAAPIRPTTDAAHASPGGPKHAAQGKKNARSVRVAGLKKR